MRRRYRKEQETSERGQRRTDGLTAEVLTITTQDVEDPLQKNLELTPPRICSFTPITFLALSTDPSIPFLSFHPPLLLTSSFLSFPFPLYLLSSYSYSPFTPLYSSHSLIFLLSLFVFFPLRFLLPLVLFALLSFLPFFFIFPASFISFAHTFLLFSSLSSPSVFASSSHFSLCPPPPPSGIGQPIYAQWTQKIETVPPRTHVLSAQLRQELAHPRPTARTPTDLPSRHALSPPLRQGIPEGGGESATAEPYQTEMDVQAATRLLIN